MLCGFRPQCNHSQVRVHCGTRFRQTGCWSIAKCRFSTKFLKMFGPLSKNIKDCWKIVSKDEKTWTSSSVCENNWRKSYRLHMSGCLCECWKCEIGKEMFAMGDRCGKFVWKSNAKADLLNEVSTNQNTSLAPDACVFGPSLLNITFELGNIFRSDVQRVLRSLPNKTSCGSDKISYPMLKEAGQGLVGPLVSLFNASLRLRQVPD